MLAFPFNFNPNVSDVKFGSYTIPAGRYALVVPNGSWLQIGSDVLGFKPVLYQDDTINEPGFANVPLYRTIPNNTGASLFCSITNVTNWGAPSTFVRLGALAPGEPTASLGDYLVFDELFPGGGKFHYRADGATTVDPNFKFQHFIEIPNGHTFERVYQHLAPGDGQITYKLFSKEKLTGEHWVKGGVSVDGDQYTVHEFIIPT